MRPSSPTPLARFARPAAIIGLLVAGAAGIAIAADQAGSDGEPHKKVTSGANNTNGTVHMPKPGTKMVLAQKDTRKTTATLNQKPGAMPSLDQIQFGDPDAKITIIEYGSPSCSHCASFHNDVLPTLKEKYIDTGKVKLVFRPFMLGGQDVQAGLLIACQVPERREALLNVIFKTQSKWVPRPTWSYGQEPTEAQVRAYADTLTKNIRSIGTQSGLSGADFDACMDNETNKKWLQAILSEAQAEHKVSATPTFVINGVVKTNMSLSAFESYLDKLDSKG